MFRSFFFAGFECATGFNAHGQWIDQIAATGHDKHADADYQRLREVGIFAARDGIRWPLVDRNGRYDFSSIQPILDASRRHGIEVIWDLFHYGYPHGLNLLSPEFPRRFADYCHAVASHVCRHYEGKCYFTPINEPSFFAWAAGDVGRFAPHWKGRGQDLKVALAQAAIQGVNAIFDAAAGARIVNVDPICHTVAPPNRPDLEMAVAHFNERLVFESWDMIAGRVLPELGGSRRHLDIVGINYYWTNQWEIGKPEHPLTDQDSRLVPLRQLIRRVWERYDGDLLVTETTHVHERRPGWVQYVAEEAEALLVEGVPLSGVCLYPILGMPEWHAQEEWVLMGLWDCVRRGSQLSRELCSPMLQALRKAQRLDFLKMQLESSAQSV